MFTPFLQAFSELISWQITADYNRYMCREAGCNIARNTKYLAATSPFPCVFSLKIGYLRSFQASTEVYLLLQY